MSPNRFFTSFLVGWPAVVCLVLTGRIASVGSGLSASEYAGWFFLAGVPVAIRLMILRNRASKSITRVLYDAEQLSDAGARARARVSRG